MSEMYNNDRNENDNNYINKDIRFPKNWATTRRRGRRGPITFRYRAYIEKKTRPITFRCRAYLVAFYLSLGLYGVGLSVSLLRSVAGPNEFLADHLEKLVVERPEEVAESLESIFVDVGVLAPLGLPETLERRLGVVGAFQARKSFRRIENKVLFRDHSTQAWRRKG